MIRHALRLAAITIAALACMFYPFMPGPHDRLAVTLSAMAQVLGLAGVLMVPIGVVWLGYELNLHRARHRGAARPASKRHWFAFSAVAASVAVGAGVALAAAASAGFALALLVVLVWVHLLRRAAASVRQMRGAGSAGVNATPVYLIVVPSVLMIARLTLLPDAVESARLRAIAGSDRFIAAIEAYRAAAGRYPNSLASVHHDYDPPTVGVERYHYEPYREAYNVFFEQPTFPLGMQEFVMYNPRDEHVMMVHNQDLLESPPHQVEAERSFHARRAHAAGVPHWKYFWFD